MTRDFKSRDKLVSPVLETRADKKIYFDGLIGMELVTVRLLDWNFHVPSILLSFSSQECDFKNDVIEVVSIIKILLQILSVRAKNSGAEKGPWTALRCIKFTTTCTSKLSVVISFEIPKDDCRQDIPNNLFPLKSQIL